MRHKNHFHLSTRPTMIDLRIDLGVVRTSSVLASFLFIVACGQSDSAEHRASSAAPLLNGQAVQWTGLVNASLQGDSLVKTGGEPQMEDSGAVSAQQIASGEAWFELT